jgi:tRNA(fMet)-specific endonuclease VapC
MKNGSTGMTGTTHPQYLIDTVAAIARLNGDRAFETALDPLATISIPVIVLGELYAGAENSLHVEANITKIDQFVNKTALVLCDEQTAPVRKNQTAIAQKGPPNSAK